MHVHVITLVHKLDYDQLENASELVYTCSINVQLLDQVWYDFEAESERALLCKQHAVDSIKDDLLHGWEIEILDSQLSAILDVYTQMNLFLVIVLDSKDQAKVKTIGVSVLFQHVDQVIQYSWVEKLDVFDHEDDWLIHAHAFSLKNLLDSDESFFRKPLVVLS